MSTRQPTWIRSYLARYKRQVALALALGFLASGCAALLMFTSGYLISATALAATTLFSVMVPVACVQLFGLGRPLARYAERLASHDWVLRITSDVRLALFHGIAKRAGDPAREREAGEYLSLLSDDVAHLQNLYLRVVFPTVIAYLLAVSASVLFGFFSLPFALVIFVALVVVTVLLPYASLLATRVPAQRAKQLGRDETACLVDDVTGSLDWVLSGRSPEALARHAQAYTRARAVDASARGRQRAFSLASTLALGALLCAVIAWAGATLGGSDATANWIAAFALGFFPLIESFAVLVTSFSQSTAHQGAIRRLAGYVGTPSCGRRRGGESASRAGAIEFEGVSYAYPGSIRPALDGFTLAVEPGQRVAVLGRSGSGKSTFARLACRMLDPDAGSVRVGGAVGYLGQQPYLFNRTLRANLQVAAQGADDAEIACVLESVGLARKLATLPAGLDTVIGETGVGFSGGEAHRVALARVLLADTPIVVVDEPFSALDPDTERALLDTLLDVCATKTLVVITHHLAQIERFDRVVFIEDAQVDLDGAPAELLASSGRFSSLVAFDRA